MTPPVFIVDTNVVVAGLITRSSLNPVARALDGMLSGSFEPIAKLPVTVESKPGKCQEFLFLGPFSGPAVTFH